MIDVEQFRLHIVRATLMSLRMWSMAAENLLLGTAVQESGLKYLRQFNDGPARGLYQIEPATHDDIWDVYLKHHRTLKGRIEVLVAPVPSRIDQLATNLAYATAIARMVYWRHPEPLPAPGDVDGLAGYWKKYFNTVKGKGRVADFAAKYRRHVLGETG